MLDEAAITAPSLKPEGMQPLRKTPGQKDCPRMTVYSQHMLLIPNVSEIDWFIDKY
jgi:hypothetical protein